MKLGDQKLLVDNKTIKIEVVLREPKNSKTHSCPQCNFGRNSTWWHIQCYLRQSAITKHEKSHDCNASVYQNTQSKTVRKEMSPRIRKKKKKKSNMLCLACEREVIRYYYTMLLGLW